MPRTITTCAGIGDTLWLFQKLINQPEAFNWLIPGGHPRRGHQVFELFPQLTASFDWVDDLGYKKIKATSYRGKWSGTPSRFTLEANTHLEAGRRIEKFLPDLETSYRLSPNTVDEDGKMAHFLLYGNPIPPISHRPRMIGIYTSAYSNARHTGGWTVEEWLQFVNLLPTDYTLVFIGAPYDTGIAHEVMDRCGRPFVNTIGQPLGVVIEILKRLEVFIGFPSGLSILNELIGAKRTLMFYPTNLAKMINTWADPSRIESGEYKGCLWCSPEDIGKWVSKNWSL